jgi:ADP-ribosyl-[dinitrogen reductase] hydrolase
MEKIMADIFLHLLKKSECTHDWENAVEQQLKDENGNFCGSTLVCPKCGITAIEDTINSELDNNNIEQKLKLDCFYSAAIGDSLGESFEFKKAKDIKKHYIMNPSQIPYDYKTWKEIPVGTITDDFSQMLLKIECYSDNSLIYSKELSKWLMGKYWTNGKMFDCGNQTFAAIDHLERTGKVLMNPNGSGNGSLMSTLPVAFQPYGNIGRDSYYFSHFTHNSHDALNSCNFYCKLVHRLWKSRIDDTYDMMFEFENLWDVVAYEIDFLPHCVNVTGTGYCIDSLVLAYKHIMTSESFVEAITKSILFGFDTDTNSSILAPIAALVFGIDDIPQEWHDIMKVNEVNPYYNKLFKDYLPICK